MSTTTVRGRLGRRFIPLLLVIPVLVTIAVSAFTWASANPQPHDVPIGVVGPPAAIQNIEDRMAEHDGAYELHTYGSAAQARDAIEDREVYGALVQTQSGSQLLTASAASPAVAELLTATFASPSSGDAATVTDVVPADADDPRGTALGSMVLPLVLVSVVTSVIVLMTARPGWQQITMLAIGAVIGAFTAIAIAQGGFGVLQGNWALNLIAPTLTIMALASAIVGAVSAFGRFGFVAVAPVMIFVGNPWAGATSAPHLLPDPAGLIGQLLPPGAGATALRSTAFFDGAGASTSIIVLLAWITLGLCGIAVGVRRRRHAGDEVRKMVAPVAAALRT